MKILKTTLEEMMERFGLLRLMEGNDIDLNKMTEPQILNLAKFLKACQDYPEQTSDALDLIGDDIMSLFLQMWKNNPEATLAALKSIQGPATSPDNVAGPAIASEASAVDRRVFFANVDEDGALSFSTVGAKNIYFF